MNETKQWESIVQETRKQVVSKFRQLYSSVDFGAYIQPENYFVSYIFKTDRALEKARESGLLEEICEYHKETLRANGYPERGICDCTFASQEDCDRQNDGNWYYYYK